MKMTAMNAAASLNVACVSQPGFPRTLKEKASCSCGYAEFSSLQSSWTSSFTKMVLRSSRLQPYGYLLFYPRATTRKRSFHAVSFQDVAENDSEGNETTLDWQRRERVWRQLQGSLQHWRQELKDRGSLQIAKELLAITEVRLKNTDAKQVLTQKLQTLKPPQPSSLWSSIDPSIKWPVLTFAFFYLAVAISCGRTVSDKLWRVWIVGPLAMSFYIQAGVYAGRLFQRYGAPHAKAQIERATQLVEDIRSGKLQQNVHIGIAYAKKYAATARSSGLHYLKTKAAIDVRDVLIRVAMWLYEKYEDVIDWLWPSWRIFVRLLANLF